LEERPSSFRGKSTGLGKIFAEIVFFELGLVYFGGFAGECLDRGYEFATELHFIHKERAPQ
jgi:hypothetical protein